MLHRHEEKNLQAQKSLLFSSLFSIIYIGARAGKHAFGITRVNEGISDR